VLFGVGISFICRLNNAHISRKILGVCTVLSFAMLAIILTGDRIMANLGPIYMRFAADDFDTLFYRLNAVVFFVKNVLNPAYWLPINPTAYFDTYGSAPHFNPAALLVLGGLPAVFMWVLLQVKPVVELSRQIFVGVRTEAVAKVVGITSLLYLLVSLSLAVPDHDQMWLWSGAALGYVSRPRAARR